MCLLDSVWQAEDASQSRGIEKKMQVNETHDYMTPNTFLLGMQKVFTCKMLRLSPTIASSAFSSTKLKMTAWPFDVSCNHYQAMPYK